MVLILEFQDFRTNKPSDIISTLVSIYDSQELFVKELQVLLAQRLLAIKDGNFEREVSVPTFLFALENHTQVDHSVGISKS